MKRNGGVFVTPTVLPLANRVVAAPFVALFALSIAYACSLGMQSIVGYPMPILPLVVFTFIVARFGSSLASGLMLIGAIVVMGSGHFPGTEVSLSIVLPFVEMMLLGSGALWAGRTVRQMHDEVSRLSDARTLLTNSLAHAAAQKRVVLRDVLRVTTEGAMILCDSAAELPDPLPFAPGEEPFPLASAALSNVRDRIRQAGEYVKMSPTKTGGLVMAGSEAALNAVVHAASGSAEVRALPKSGRVQVWIRDNGSGIDESLLHRAVLEAGFSSKGSLGQGFALITQTCDQVYLLTGATGTVIVLESGTI